MNKNEHAETLNAVSQVYPAGDIYDALMAGAAALRGECKVSELLQAEALDAVAKIVGNAYAARVMRAEAARLRSEAPDAR